MRILFINSDWNNEYRKKHNKFGGVGYYRLWSPMRALQKKTDWQCDFLGSDFESLINQTNEDTILKSYIDIFAKYDLVILKHFDNPNAARFILAASDYTGVPFVTDLDDDVFSVRKDQPASKLGYSPGEIQRGTVATMISFSKAIFVTNDFLGKKITDHIKKSCNVELPYYVLPNYNNIDEWDYKTAKDKSNITIGWHGSITHDADLQMIMPVLQSLVEKYPKLKLSFMGGVNKEFALKTFKSWDTKYLDRISLLPGTRAWHNFPYKLMRQTWDIGIAPLIDDEFNKSKSNIKWMEYSMKKIPTVASDVLPYQNIEHGKTGFLCKTNEEWFDTLEMLIRDNELRKTIGESAYNEVKNNWQYIDHANKWKSAIESVLKSN